MVHTRHKNSSSPDSPKDKKDEIIHSLKSQHRIPLNGVDIHKLDNLRLEQESRVSERGSPELSPKLTSKMSPKLPRSLSPKLSSKISPDRYSTHSHRDDHSRRRSSREKRFTYDTLNQSNITNLYLGLGDIDERPVSSRHRKSSSSSPNRSKNAGKSPIRGRRGRPSKRSLIEMTNNEEAINDSSNIISPVVSNDEMAHDDMYTRIKRQRRESRRVTYFDNDFITSSVRTRRFSKNEEMNDDNVRRSMRQRRKPRRRFGLRKRRKTERLISGDVLKTELTNEKEMDENHEEVAPENGDNDEDDEEEEEEEEEEESSESSEEEAPRKYSLRERRPPPIPIYQPEFGERRLRRTRMSNLLRRRHPSPEVCRPSRRAQVRSRMHRSTVHNRGSSSTSSSSSDSEVGTSADEARFQRRKTKSMARARKRCLPMNFTEEDLKNHLVLRDRSMAGASLADVEPMTIDKEVTFESVGGLDHVLRSLKEMVLFPLLYSEVFENFNVAPPRGVLFHGPPGTGKTLVARALANVCSQSGRKIAFFMRKGADCLSKWVGESERQLRLLFNEAYTMRPSIIFFDEIDGLAPVRSTRQDQIHSSIVSTLLALLDGLDSRGEVVVIGATNRLDAIDPALRRPGRFDREFFFPLPREAARLQILQIHTSKWPRPLSGNILDRLAKATSGYCGADLKSLCTEAVLSALRRRYPQVYMSKVKLQIDMNEIEVTETDFQAAMESIVAAGHRVECSPSRPLSEAVMPLVKDVLDNLLERIRMEFPAAAQVLRRQAAGEDIDGDGLISEDALDENGKAPSWSRFVLGGRGPRLLCRPRLMLLPDEEESQINLNQSWDENTSNDGQSVVPISNTIDQHILPALFHRLEGIHVFTVDTPTLFHVSARTPEESLSQLWREALRLAPSIIYIPNINELLMSLPETVIHCLISLIRGGDPTVRIFILATVTDSRPLQHQRVAQFFSGCIHRCSARSTQSARRLFFKDIFVDWPSVPPPQRRQTAQRALEVLPPVPESEQNVPRKLSTKEAECLFEQEEFAMCQLRLLLREVLSKLTRDRRFSIFTRPVDREEVPDYYDIIKKPMDLSTISHKLDTHRYETTQAFLDDVNQICSNALEYNPDTTPADRELRHRACCLRDSAMAEIKVLIADEFIERCEYISSSRKRRGVNSESTKPNYYLTKPSVVEKTSSTSEHLQSASRVGEKNTPVQSSTTNSGTATPSGTVSSASGPRLSRRLQHLGPDNNSRPSYIGQKRRSRTKKLDDSNLADTSNLHISVEVGSESVKQDGNMPSCNGILSASPNGGRGDETTEDQRIRLPGSNSPDNKNEKKEIVSSARSNEKKQESKDFIPRLTRGLVANNPLAEYALSILRQPTQELVVPVTELSNLLDRCVAGTEGWSVSHLEHLYSRLAARLISFECVWDRTRLVAEYEEILSSFNI